MTDAIKTTENIGNIQSLKNFLIEKETKSLKINKRIIVATIEITIATIITEYAAAPSFSTI